jgi:hypothetical protein
MSIASQATQQKFPFGYDAVFDGLVEVIPQLGLNIKSHDKPIGRLTASAGMSMFSWGENLTVVVEKIDENNTLVAIESALKFGANLGGAHRHQKNFNMIISRLSQHLQDISQAPLIEEPLIATSNPPEHCPKCSSPYFHETRIRIKHGRLAWICDYPSCKAVFLAPTKEASPSGIVCPTCGVAVTPARPVCPKCGVRVRLSRPYQ